MSPIEIFETTIQDTPKHTCSICQLLCFMKDIRPMKQKEKNNYYTLTQIKYEALNNFICQTCLFALKHFKLPTYSTPKNIRINKPIQDVWILSQLEEWLVLMRIVFAQIWELRYKTSQVGLIGSIINVPMNMNIIQNALPQATNSTKTTVLACKRHLEYKNAFQIGMVRPNVVMQELSKLTNTPLYIMVNVKIKDDWKESLEINIDNEMTYASSKDEHPL